MAKQGRSDPTVFGGMNHYDANGKKIGHSEPGLFGGFTDYDAKGHKIGHSEPGIFGGYTHYDSKGHKVGRSDPGIFGGYTHYDAKGKKTGSSDPTIFGGYSHNDTQGCYVATCVYGSYDCPEVWTLRRFRDYYLAQSVAGRTFIKVYYAVSPTIVKVFGETRSFRAFWRQILNRMVRRLLREGYEDSPYDDKNW